SVIENVRSTGEKITCEWFNTPLRGRSGEIVGVLSMIHDITEKIRLEKKLRTDQRMESVGTLAGGVAHEFNNALTGIIGFGEILRERISGDPRAVSDLDQILRCAERAATLTRQLLTFARRVASEPVNLSLNDVVSDLMKLVAKVAGARVDVRTFLAKDLPTIRADRGQVEQVLMNLCLNARDEMPEGGRLLVETEAATLEDEYIKRNPHMRPGRYALLKVTDTGNGMDDKTRERVFEPFFTTKGPNKGTGLGLAMAYGIVKQHDGFIYLYSEPGMGATFKVYFPAVEAPPDALGAARQEPVRGGTEIVLLADDEEAIRELAEEALGELGYTVLAARNGEKAVEIFKRLGGEIALAILDLVMPPKGGKEVFDELRKENPKIKVIFTSGYSANAVHESFALFAGVPFLPKPFGPASLARKVREVLDGDG
ncbi:MAG: response regulator, partial [Deltaproteobacteria bacterium]|nr:response regulator [Deltaproteobacteria bacterium]